MSKPLFYVKGTKIYQRPVKSAEGLVTVGFLVCQVASEVNPDAVCDLLNKADPPPKDEPCIS